MEVKHSRTSKVSHRKTERDHIPTKNPTNMSKLRSGRLRHSVVKGQDGEGQGGYSRKLRSSNQKKLSEVSWSTDNTTKWFSLTTQTHRRCGAAKRRAVEMVMNRCGGTKRSKLRSPGVVKSSSGAEQEIESKKSVSHTTGRSCLAVTSVAGVREAPKKEKMLKKATHGSQVKRSSVTIGVQDKTRDRGRQGKWTKRKPPTTLSTPTTLPNPATLDGPIERKRELQRQTMQRSKTPSLADTTSGGRNGSLRWKIDLMPVSLCFTRPPRSVVSLVENQIELNSVQAAQSSPGTTGPGLSIEAPIHCGLHHSDPSCLPDMAPTESITDREMDHNTEEIEVVTGGSQWKQTNTRLASHHVVHKPEGHSSCDLHRPDGHMEKGGFVKSLGLRGRTVVFADLPPKQGHNKTGLGTHAVQPCKKRWPQIPEEETTVKIWKSSSDTGSTF